MRIAQGIFWWIVTLTTLIIVDDLLFGPFFWALALWSAPVATIIAFAASYAMQIWLIRAGTRPDMGRIARAMLARMMLGHKREEIAVRETSLKERSATIAGAFIMTPIIGGVLPALLLAKRGVDVTRLSYLLALIYSIEFAAIHGGYGFGWLVRVMVL